MWWVWAVRAGSSEDVEDNLADLDGRKPELRRVESQLVNESLIGVDRVEIIYERLLYGEKVEIIEEIGSFSKIKMVFDGYEGWVDAKQISKISEEDFAQKNSQILTEDFKVFNFKNGRN